MLILPNEYNNNLLCFVEAKNWKFQYGILAIFIHIIFGKQPKYHIEASDFQLLQNITDCYCLQQEDLTYYYVIGYRKCPIYNAINDCGRSNMVFLLIQQKNKNQQTILAQMPCFAYYDLLQICISNFFYSLEYNIIIVFSNKSKKILLMFLEDEIGKL